MDSKSETNNQQTPKQQSTGHQSSSQSKGKNPKNKNKFPPQDCTQLKSVLDAVNDRKTLYEREVEAAKSFKSRDDVQFCPTGLPTDKEVREGQVELAEEEGKGKSQKSGGG